MNEEENKARRAEVRDELGTLMQEWVNLTDDPEGTSGLLTACVISFESTRYNHDGEQGYRTDYITLPPTSYSAMIGILNETIWTVHHNSFGHCHGGD